MIILVSIFEPIGFRESGERRDAKNLNQCIIEPSQPDNWQLKIYRKLLSSDLNSARKFLVLAWRILQAWQENLDRKH